MFPTFFKKSGKTSIDVFPDFETHLSPDFLRRNNEVLYHYFETLRVSKCHFLKGLEIMRPWQESCVEATFLPKNFLKMLEIMRFFFFGLAPTGLAVELSRPAKRFG